MSAPSPMCRVATVLVVLAAFAAASAFGLQESNANPQGKAPGASDSPSGARELPARSARPRSARPRPARSLAARHTSGVRAIHRTSQRSALQGVTDSRTSNSRARRGERRRITPEEARRETRLRSRRELAREHSAIRFNRTSADQRREPGPEPARTYEARRRYRTARERRREQALRRVRSPSSVFTPSRVAVDFHPQTGHLPRFPSEPTQTNDRAVIPAAAESGSFAVRRAPLDASGGSISRAAPTPVAAEAESSPPETSDEAPDEAMGAREYADSSLNSVAAAESSAATDSAMESDAAMAAATRAAAEELSPDLAGGAMPPPLRGSLASLQRQDARLEAEGLERIEDDADLTTRISRGALVPVPASAALTINPELPALHRYCRPWTAQFLSDLARAHAAIFARPLDVSSAVRTVAYQRHLMRVNGNAAPAEGDLFSPHLMGATVDIGKKGMSWREIAWMRRWLLNLEASGKLDVEEEFDQACFHITVYKTYAPHGAGRAEEPLTADESSR